MIATHARAIEELTHQACDLDVAIAALEFAPSAEPEPTLPSMDDIFAADDTQAPATEDANRIEGASEVVTSPGEVGESRDHFALIDQQTCEPVSPLPLPEPEWNDPPEPEGYAPVTNPDAEAQAKALDYYSPERIAERTRFNPFAVFRREPEGV
jgi:hypothetical protein